VTAESLGHMHDVQCQVDFIVGTGRITVGECLRLERQSVLRLNQSAGADIELHVHGVALAAGEVVIVDDSTTLRIGRIVPPPGVEATA
jgi:flagellar motor switch/type III secretory pathway protein FliN